MKLRSLVFVIVAVASLEGCTTFRGAVASGQANLAFETISVDALNRISGVVVFKGDRETLSTTVAECGQGHGDLRSDPIAAHPLRFQNALLTGATGPDGIFSSLCAAGLSIAQQRAQEWQATWSRMSPAERADYQRRVQAVLGAFATQDAAAQQRRIQESHDQAIRDAGAAIGTAIREHGSRPVNCQPNGDGVYTCTPE
jgi:hypothetical protein